MECGNEMECSIYMECSIDMNMQHGHGMQYEHGHAAWTWTHSTDFVTWTWTVDMHGCQNADKKLSPASLVFR